MNAWAFLNYWKHVPEQPQVHAYGTGRPLSYAVSKKQLFKINLIVFKRIKRLLLKILNSAFSFVYGRN